MVIRTETVDAVDSARKYKYGWETDINTEKAPKGLNEEIVRFISHKKGEPDWMLKSRLKAFDYWLSIKDKEPQ